MWKLIKNELLKLSRKNKLYIIIGFLVLITLAQCYVLYEEITNERPEKVVKECERYIENLKSMTVIKTGGSDETGDNSFMVTDRQGNAVKVDNAIENAEKELERARRKLENMTKDWKVNVRDELTYLDTQKEKYRTEGNDGKLEAVTTQINMLNYYLDRDMKPDEDYIMKSTVIIDIITFISSYFLAIIVMMLTVESIAGENVPGTIKLLLAKPISRGRIYLSKFLTSVIMSLGIVFMIEIAAYLIIGLIFGFGNMRAPVAIGPKYIPDPIQIARDGMGVMPALGSTILVPLWQKLALVLLLQGIFSVTIVSFGMFLSTIMKSGISAIVFGLLTTAILTIITLQIRDYGSIKVISTIMPFLFSTYSAGSFILTGFLSNSVHSTIISVPFAVSVMAVWAVIFFVPGYRIFVKRDVLA